MYSSQQSSDATAGPGGDSTAGGPSARADEDDVVDAEVVDEDERK
jgi:hypothetical protein